MRIPALLLALLLSSPVYAYQVIGITDGDTIKILRGRKEVRIRLAGVDAPEKAQPYGERSKQSLSDLCWGKDVEYTKVGSHRDRIVAKVMCGGINVNREQVKRGMAMIDPRYNKDRSLPAIQERARELRQGLWRDSSPTAPWDFRKRKVSNEIYDASQL